MDLQEVLVPSAHVPPEYHIKGKYRVPIKVRTKCEECGAQLIIGCTQTFFEKSCEHYQFWPLVWERRVVEEGAQPKAVQTQQQYVTARCKCGFENPYATSTNYTCQQCKLWSQVAR